MSRPIELGSGQVTSDTSKPVVHFGSATGSQFGAASPIITSNGGSR